MDGYIYDNDELMRQLDEADEMDVDVEGARSAPIVNPFAEEPTDRGAVVKKTAEDKRDQPLEIAFTHSTLAACFLPAADPGNESVWFRVDGKRELIVESGSVPSAVPGGKPEKVGLPFGRYARLILADWMNRAARSASPTIELPRSIRSYMTGLGLDPGGDNMEAFKNQFKRLAACHVQIIWRQDDGRALVQKTDFAKAAIWQDGSDGFLPTAIRLDDDLHDAILDRSLPYNMDDLTALQAPTAMDMYLWLVGQLHDR